MSDCVIVVGGGHNGLTCAALLAKAGRRVTVLERRSTVGGLCAAEEFHPGYTAPGILHDTSMVRASVVSELSLASHGLKRGPKTPLVLAAPAAVGGGQSIELSDDREKTAASIAAVSKADGAAWSKYRGFLDRIGGFFSKMMDTEPPEVTRDDMGVLWHLFKVGFSLRRLGAADMSEVMRVPPMTAADWLREYFETERLVAGLAWDACASTWAGPHSPGTAATMLLSEAMRGQEVEGGPPALIEALTAACEAAGVMIRTEAEVTSIRVENGRCAGVTLADDTRLEGQVVSTLDPKRTVLELLAPAHTPPSLIHAMERYRARGTTAVVRLALTGLPEGAAKAMRIADDVDTLERAFDAVKYRRVADLPVLDVRFPTLSQPNLAPEGHHVVTILVRFAPYHLEGGWTDERRQNLGDSTIRVLERYTPGLKDLIEGHQVLTPADLERGHGLTGGHLYHGEHALDQLMSLRPVPACANHRTPIEGLYVGSGGTHPGGGITGGPGRLAAKAVTAD